MRIFTGQSLAARLTWGFGTILVLLVALAALSLVRMQEMTSTLEEITVRNAERSRAVGVLARGVSEYVQALGDLGATDLGGAAAVLTKIQSTLTGYDTAQSQLSGLMPKDARRPGAAAVHQPKGNRGPPTDCACRKAGRRTGRHGPCVSGSQRICPGHRQMERQSASLEQGGQRLE